MTRRPALRVLLTTTALATVAMLSACGSDEPGEGSPTVTPEPTTSASTQSTNPVTVVTTTLAAGSTADCAELEGISAEISAAFPDGVGVEEGAVLDADQIAAVRDLGARFAAVEIDDAGLAELRDRVVTAAEAAAAVGEAGEALTSEEAAALTGVLYQMGSLCEAARD